ncbi:hypothetical protein PROFUN_15250 [Planoprotostelium fungivorum]|uniref:Methylated-DNA--protein-cysteine methyltransferase n=1 Tax=Planoprotostelium fungivorum TaxID=1890364 RepID=A0A2P6MXM1_9EUKA|nr:hypothetical protein PROFUN_15250 [Planoprotostelium fungivorum]
MAEKTSRFFKKTTEEPISVVRDPSTITYPKSSASRDIFRRDNGKPVTAFQWRVYDAIQHIPPGRITTYAALAAHLKTSPRAVGNALRENPFFPLIPCHRVISSSGTIGGFQGQRAGKRVDNKKEMLKSEGIPYSEKETEQMTEDDLNRVLYSFK